MSTAIVTTTPNEITTHQFDTSILTGQLAESSIAMYKRDFGAYLEFAGSFTNAIIPETLAQWRTHLANETTKSPNTINRMLSAVKRLISEAAQQGYTSHENADAFGRVQGVKVKAMRDRRKQDARTKITPEDMRQIVNQPKQETLAGKMHYALLSTLAATGMRISEAVGLTVNQILWETNEDTGKSGWVCALKDRKNDDADDERNHPEPETNKKPAIMPITVQCKWPDSTNIVTHKPSDRRKKEYCSSACKQKAYRARHRPAEKRNVTNYQDVVDVIPSLSRDELVQLSGIISKQLGNGQPQQPVPDHLQALGDGIAYYRKGKGVTHIGFPDHAATLCGRNAELMERIAPSGKICSVCLSRSTQSWVKTWAKT